MKFSTNLAYAKGAISLSKTIKQLNNVTLLAALSQHDLSLRACFTLHKQTYAFRCSLKTLLISEDEVAYRYEMVITTTPFSPKAKYSTGNELLTTAFLVHLLFCIMEHPAVL